ncbi:MAG: hypothetical protein HND46_00160 [Chloroflexi bacterium]|nr:hypothetical protein [Chloroflexota bacterium]
MQKTPPFSIFTDRNAAIFLMGIIFIGLPTCAVLLTYYLDLPAKSTHNKNTVAPSCRTCSYPYGKPDDELLFIYAGSLVLVDEDGNETVLRDVRVCDADWSADGAKIIFSPADNCQASYVMETDGTNIHPITSNDLTSSIGEYSPDGSTRVFSSNGAISISNSDGSDTQQLTSSKFGEYDPVWSSDGSKIAFVCEVHETASDSVSAICIMNADGSDIRIVSDYWQSHSPRWRP